MLKKNHKKILIMFKNFIDRAKKKQIKIKIFVS